MRTTRMTIAIAQGGMRALLGHLQLGSYLTDLSIILLDIGGDMGSFAPDYRIFIASLLAVQLVHMYPAKA